MEIEFSDFLKVYGPMAIGWVLYAFERKNNLDERAANNLLQEKVYAAFIEDTKAKILQQASYDRLIAVIGKPV